MKNLYLDLETSGLDPQKHGIIQLAYILEENGQILKQNNFNMNPQGKILDSKALLINGYTEEEINKFPFYKLQIFKFLYEIQPFLSSSFYERFQIIGYNVNFDVEFLKVALQEINVKFNDIFQNRFVDPLQFLYYLRFLRKVDFIDYKLETVCSYFGVPIQAHDALSDIQATRELLYRLHTFVK